MKQHQTSAQRSIFHRMVTGLCGCRLPYGERIKLVQPKVLPTQSPVCDYVYERHGYAYLTFIVGNMKELLARLTAQNLKVVSDGLVEVRKGVFALFILDPEGNFVEFVDYPDIASYRPDLIDDCRLAG